MSISRIRCPWVDLNKPDYVKYHDTEWGVPVHDDRLLFEFLILEAFQAGLSWYTILRRRDTFREAFDDFDPARVARYDERRVIELLGNPGIIRNRAKILATIRNAAKFLEIQQTFGSFDSYIWNFVDNRPIVNSFRSLEDFPAKTPLSEAISRDLAQRGFAFVGPTIVYAHMQATGMVNDHTLDCFRRQEILSIAGQSSSGRDAETLP